MVSFIVNLYSTKGLSAYGENISQVEHAAQTWWLAHKSQADLELRVAAFIHDVGHLMADVDNIDFHEKIGASWVDRTFQNQLITDVTASHVLSKRYLATKYPDYLSKLSDESKRTFVLQGAYLQEKEILAFENNPFFEECIKLRFWDDEAKQTNANFWGEYKELIVKDLEASLL